jgi:hypothetical protein
MMTVAERLHLVEQFEAYMQTREAMERAARAKPVTIDIPFPKPAADPEVRRCVHRRADGRQCESPPIKIKDECARHNRWSFVYPTALPFPEDALGLQEMLGYVVVCVIDKLIDADQARAITELCRIMEKNLPRCESELESMVRRR